jgi:hypothetical protein
MEIIAGRKAEVLNLAAVVTLLLTLCLVVPLLAGGAAAGPFNQFIIGPLVNAALIYSGVRLRRAANLLLVATLPGAAAIALGVLGINAVFMLYMVAFIWAGNLALAFSFRAFAKSGYTVAAVFGITAKVALIFGGFLILRACGAFPTPVAETMFSMMGAVQFLTATLGAALAYPAISASATRRTGR